MSQSPFGVLLLKTIGESGYETSTGHKSQSPFGVLLPQGRILDEFRDVLAFVSVPFRGSSTKVNGKKDGKRWDGLSPLSGFFYNSIFKVPVLNISFSSIFEKKKLKKVGQLLSDNFRRCPEIKSPIFSGYSVRY